MVDEHNGRCCITPEYPNGTYAYFSTVDSNWNSAYPYAVGPTFYGTYANRKVTSINEITTRFIPSITGILTADIEAYEISVYPNPASELIAIQIGSLVNQDVSIQLINGKGKFVKQTVIKKGSSIAYFDIQTVYSGVYFLRFTLHNGSQLIEKVVVNRD